MGSASTDTLTPRAVKVERSKWERLSIVAKANQRSTAAEIRWLIDRRLDEAEKAAA